jgi:preprotein translocase subunit SecY
LIIVGVILDTMRQVETHLIQRHYDGFLRKGKIRGRFDRTPAGRGEAVQQGALLWLYVGIAILVVAGMAIFVAGRFQ